MILTRTMQWSWLPILPYFHCNLVTVSDRKQLLAIGGMVKNNGVDEITNKVFLCDEEKKKWTTPYPNMPTTWCRCSSVSHGSTVIVAGGVTCWDPWTLTRAVEVLHIKEHILFTKSYWSVVEQLPLVVCGAIPVVISNTLHITVGFDKRTGASTCNIVTTSLSELLQSSNKNTSSSQVWNKLPDMPYSSLISHYQGHLITFGGIHVVEQPGKDKPVWQVVPQIHIYNPVTTSWDHVGEICHEYLLVRSVHIRENKILFIGGLTGTCSLSQDDDMIKTCLTLTLSP